MTRGKETLKDENTVIRPGAVSDAGKVYSIAQAAYAMYVPRMDRKPFPMLDDYESHIRKGNLFVLEINGEVQGFAVLLPADPATLLLDNVAVSPACQGRGYGRLLIEYAQKAARACGCAQIILYTNQAMTENQTLYPYLGFAESRRVTEKGYQRIYYVKQL